MVHHIRIRLYIILILVIKYYNGTPSLGLIHDEYKYLCVNNNMNTTLRIAWYQ